MIVARTNVTTNCNDRDKVAAVDMHMVGEVVRWSSDVEKEFLPHVLDSAPIYRDDQRQPLEIWTIPLAFPWAFNRL